MTEYTDLTQVDFETAYRIAKARGMAERSRIAHALISSAVHSVRCLFSRPEADGCACNAEA